MERALQLAAYGTGYVSPNPMVGAVITAPDGRIIGEGWHRLFGGPHAEVNAVASVKSSDIPLLKDSTIYVTLEPCSHYGKTPPCAALLIEKGIGRVVVGSADPFKLVSGRGIKMLREAGIEVVENFMRKECDELNKRFITAHTLGRPYILLKWAQSADGFIARKDEDGNPEPVRLSTPLSSGMVHALRGGYDAILVGTNTVVTDNPRLDTRQRPGKSPRPVTFRSPKLNPSMNIFRRDPILLDPTLTPEQQMEFLYREHGITSVIVEGGAKVLQKLLNVHLFDEIRVETSPQILRTGVEAPILPSGITLEKEMTADGNLILTFQRSK